MNNRRKLRIGIVGCGTIGAQLARAIEERFSRRARLSALCDIDRQKAENLRASLSGNPRILSLAALIKDCHLIIEAASAQISFMVAQKALRQKRDVMIMSVGGILERQEELFALARKSGARIYLPSGAICGLDALKAAALTKIEQVTLITRKPPQSLAGAPYLLQRNIDLSRIKGERTIFEGTAVEAVKGFPRNVNICATLSLAGIGAEKTKVKIITSPHYKANIHELQVEGDFGRLTARTENLPSPVNPRTSFLASLSAIATLKDILEAIKIGT